MVGDGRVVLALELGLLDGALVRLVEVVVWDGLVVREASLVALVSRSLVHLLHIIILLDTLFRSIFAMCL